MSAFLKIKIDEVTGIKRPKLSIDADLSQSAENAAFLWVKVEVINYYLADN